MLVMPQKMEREIIMDVMAVAPDLESVAL